MIQVLPAFPAWPEVQVGDLLRYLAPDLHNHVALLPYVDICRALREPVAQVHAALPGDPHLEGAVRDEHPERVPRQRLHQPWGDIPAENSIFEPSQSPFRCGLPWNQPCKVLAYLLRYQRPDRGHPGGPPEDSREAVLWSNQGDQFDACCGDCLRLPGLQFHRVAGVDEVFGVNMLKVIEASTAPHLEPGEPQDERIQHLVSVLARGLLRAGAGGTPPPEPK